MDENSKHVLNPPIFPEVLTPPVHNRQKHIPGFNITPLLQYLHWQQNPGQGIVKGLWTILGPTTLWNYPSPMLVATSNISTGYHQRVHRELKSRASDSVHWVYPNLTQLEKLFHADSTIYNCRRWLRQILPALSHIQIIETHWQSLFVPYIHSELWHVCLNGILNSFALPWASKNSIAIGKYRPVYRCFCSQGIRCTSAEQSY